MLKAGAHYLRDDGVEMKIVSVDGGWVTYQSRWDPAGKWAESRATVESITRSLAALPWARVAAVVLDPEPPA
jgi:hypothetical protein